MLDGKLLIGGKWKTCDRKFWAIAPSLIAGNTVVFKPSDLIPFVGIEIGKICQDAGIPDGVINIVTGDGFTGKSLVSSDIGPMASKEQREKLEQQVEDAVRKGAAIKCGGKRPWILQCVFPRNWSAGWGRTYPETVSGNLSASST